MIARASMLRYVAGTLRPRTLTRSSTKFRMASTGSALYKQLAELPSYRAAQFQSDHVIRVTTSAFDHARKTKRQSIRTFFVTETSVSSALSPDAPEIVASLLSPTGAHLAVLREAVDPASPGGKKRFVEIWSEDTIEASAEVTRTHGAFYTDEYLSSISFSPSEKRLVYTAEANVPEPHEDQLEKYRFVPEFGESYAGKKKPTVFLFDWAIQEKSSVVSLSLKDQPKTPTLLSHPVFASEDKIFAVGYEYAADGRILGIIYCPNRTSGLWELSIASPQQDNNTLCCTSTKLTTADRSCRSPRILRRNSQPDLLVWLSIAVGGAHASCSTLHVKDVASGAERALVKPVWDPSTTEFPGIYVNTLPIYPFVELGGSGCIVLSSNWRSRSTVLLVSLNDGKVTELTPDDAEVRYSWTVLCTDGKDKIVCTRSAPSVPAELVLGRIDGAGHARWQNIAKPDLNDDLRNKLNTLSTSIVPVPDHYPTETIVVRSEGAASAPCITLPHGGPHSASSTAFNAWVAAFALEGYTVSMPNYTGSVGFGEKFIRKLLGQIGSLDVEDCMASIEHLVAQGVSSHGPGRQLLYGGSHGGFLLGHLIGQYPDFFSGAVLRNPVISLGEISTSDIPDWYYEESGLSFAAASLVTPEVYEKLFKMSPIAYVDAVKTPVTILVGEKDQRVAPTQGRNYYHALKARGRKVDLFCLKHDIHSLDSVEGQLVSYEAARALFDSVKFETT